MEEDRDLRKFIAETPVAQRRGMLPSGREASPAADPARATLQHRTVPAAGRTPADSGTYEEIHNVRRLTPHEDGAPYGDGWRPLGR